MKINIKGQCHVLHQILSEITDAHLNSLSFSLIFYQLLFFCITSSLSLSLLLLALRNPQGVTPGGACEGLGMFFFGMYSS